MSATEELELHVVCWWCGVPTRLGATCEACGSPMQVLAHCRYCGNLSTDAVCPECREALVRLWRLAQESPDSRFLFADVL